MLIALTLFSAASFLWFGISCLRSPWMQREFERYRLGRYRKVVGSLQLMGAVGLLAGVWYPPLGVMAAGGLTLLMLLGFGVRLKIRDSLVQTTPALFYLLLNLYLFIAMLYR